MEIEEFFKKEKEIYSCLMNFIDLLEDFELECQTLISILEKHQTLQNKEESLLLFQIISKIADNHHRTPIFWKKIDTIFHYMFQNVTEVTDFEIYQIYENNKRILYLLFQKCFIKPDESIMNKLKNMKDNDNNQYVYYLYPVLKDFLDQKTRDEIERIISNEFKEEIDTFSQKCEIGENDSYICQLIRQDSVEEFVSFVNRRNYRLSSYVPRSMFETNFFLIDKRPTLIEYATFFGSIQIFQYLRYNQVSLSESLWLYAIHSDNAELFHILEESEISKKYEESFNESIKCHHNDIANYVRDNFLNQTKIDNNLFISNCNYSFDLDIQISKLISSPKFERVCNISQLSFCLKAITIPQETKRIAIEVFRDCSTITQVFFEDPPSVTTISRGAFYNCTSLKEITIPSSVTSICEAAFNNCKSLSKVVIPSSVTKISGAMFYKCSSLKEIMIPSSITSIESYSFYGCSSLLEISIPSSVTKIGNSAFANCTSLKEITIPSSVTSIEESTFSFCLSLKQITFEMPSSVKSIQPFAFYYCSSLTEIMIPSCVTEIANCAFKKCTSLTKISFEYPSSMTSIGDEAFSLCESLTPISFPSSTISIGKNVFEGCKYRCIIQ